MFPPGTRVRVKTVAELQAAGFLGSNDLYLGAANFAPNMRKYCGKILTLSGKSICDNRYYVKEEVSFNYLTAEMFVVVKPKRNLPDWF